MEPGTWTLGFPERLIGRRTDDVRGQRRHDALTAVGPEELTIPDFDIYTTIRGAVEPRARAYAEQKIARLAHLAKGWDRRRTASSPDATGIARSWGALPE